MKFIKSSEKRRIVEKLNEQFGITNTPYLLIQVGKEKIRGYSGHLSKDEIIDIGKIANVETIGLYLMKEEHDKKIIRLGFDTTQLLRKQITKNILEISKEEFNLWIRGYDLDKETPNGIYAIMYDNIFLGCGISNGKRVFNYVPKDRRIKKPL